MLVRARHQNRTTVRVLGLLHEGELVVLDLVLVNEAGVAEVGLVQVIDGVDGGPAAGEDETGGLCNIIIGLSQREDSDRT